MKLPIDPHLAAITAAIRAQPVTLLRATPGAGKTTRVPAHLLGTSGAGVVEGKIIVLEPRRVAAKYAALRIAEERREAIGETVGYQFRFEKKISSNTQLIFLTEGMFLRWLVGNPQLDGIGMIVLDEFHERSLNGDVAIAMVRALQRGARPDLKLLLMSATLETDALQKYLEAQGLKPAVIDVEAARFPLETRYLPKPLPAERGALESAVARAVSDLMTEREQGDLLVFLPGMGEIRRCEERLTEWALERGILVFPLHGELTREEQDRAILPQKKRKIVLSTNIAETSLTIDGLSMVVDSGLARVGSFSPWSGLPALSTRAISKASAIQRAGRAARQSPGVCLRLYTQGEYEARSPFDTPEILRADLAPVFLEVLASGLGDPRQLSWLDAPSRTQSEAAWGLLWELGAIEKTGELTERGRKMAEAPAHPRITRLLEEASARKVADPALTLVAELLEGSDLPQDPIAAVLHPRQSSTWARGFAAQRTRDQLKRWLESRSANASVSAAGDAESALARAVLVGFPDRVAKKRPGSKPDAPKTELFLSSGGTAWAESTPALFSTETLVVLDAIEKKGRGLGSRPETWVSSFVPIEDDWLLDLPAIAESEQIVLEKGRSEKVSKLTYGQLTLMETRTPVNAASVAQSNSSASVAAAANAWVAEVLKKGFSLICEEGWVESFRVRLALLADPGGRSDLPADPKKWVEEKLAEFAEGKTRISELQEADFASYLKYSLDPAVTSALDRDLPEAMSLPGGKRVKISYEAGKPPWVESRMQDFFGMKETPSLLGGRIKLTVHLLAPNMRPVQVTTDLSGFWKRGYLEVRKELSRRYPRHPWPEDGASAVPPPPKPNRR